MKRPGAVLLFAITMLFAAIFQPGMREYLPILGARPDLLLTTAMVGGLLFTPGGGAVAGFFSGALAGWTSGGTLAVFAATRSIVAFGLGFYHGPELKLNGWAALALVALGTLVARLLTMFLAAPADIGYFIRDTLGTAVYNGVLGALLYLALRPLFRPKVVSLNE